MLGEAGKQEILQQMIGPLLAVRREHLRNSFHSPWEKKFKTMREPQKTLMT